MGYLFDEVNNIITVESPQTEVTCQELIDAIRDYEDGWDGIDIPQIANATGKQALGGGVLVGITIELLNWRLKFADRGGPTYIICSVSGGNLVAVDADGDSMSPIAPAAYVTVTLTASSSATLQELSSIQYASFNGGVTIDVVNGTAGTAFPKGTSELPVNNLADAKSIAVERGFRKLYIRSDLTIGAAESVNNYILQGTGLEYETITLTSGCTTNGTSFEGLSVEGVQNGETHYDKCEILALENVYCLFTECKLVGPLTMHPTSQSTSQIISCYGGVAGLGDVIVDMNNGKMNMGFKALSAGIKFINSNQSDVNVIVGIASGKVTLDSTISAGTFVIRGVVDVEDGSTGTTIVNLDGAVNVDLIWDEPLYDHLIAESVGEALSRILGVAGENVKWSGMSFDANNNLIAATITQYTDNTLVTPRKAWILAATYNANSELTSYQLKEV
jgi:hypothetical protein